MTLPEFLAPFEPFIPEPYLWLWVAPPSLAYAVLAAWVSGRLRVQFEVDVAYTRKTFHFLIIPFAGIIQIYFGLGGTVVYGSVVSLCVLYALWRADGFPFYEAMARPKDQPHRSLFVLVPLVMTGLGGVLSNLFFGAYSTIGYWACGFGDAVGEPVGRRWGNHKFRVPSMAGVPATRSLEGSFGVFLACWLAVTIALGLEGYGLSTMVMIGGACALVGALVEGVSNHGLDNLTIQLAASGVAYLFLA